MKKEWRGIPVSPGIAIGNLFCYTPHTVHVEHRTIAAGQITAEIERFEIALRQCRKAFERTRETAEGVTSKVAQLFDAQVMLLEDEILLDEIRNAFANRLHADD
ncbi:MAG: hypothetical protein OEM52_14815, partial [bacterium]|nr:hypothetical protein [bacterium]